MQSVSYRIWTRVTVSNNHYNTGVEANVLNCNIVISKFEHHLRYGIHFWINTLGKIWILSNWLNTTTTITTTTVLLQEWLWHYITHEVWYAIKTKTLSLYLVRSMVDIITSLCLESVTINKEITIRNNPLAWTAEREPQTPVKWIENLVRNSLITRILIRVHQCVIDLFLCHRNYKDIYIYIYIYILWNV